MQWIGEVMHFCPKVPVMLIGCKKDLRRDQQTNQALHKQNQRPIAPEQVSLLASSPTRFVSASIQPDPRLVLQAYCSFISDMLIWSFHVPFRVKPSHRRLVPACTSSARPVQVKVSAKSSNTPPVPLSSNQSARGVSA